MSGSRWWRNNPISSAQALSTILLYVIRGNVVLSWQFEFLVFQLFVMLYFESAWAEHMRQLLYHLDPTQENNSVTWKNKIELMKCSIVFTRIAWIKTCCLYIYIYILVCVYIYIYMCVRAFVCYLNIFWSVFICISLHISLCTYMYVSVYI